MNIRKDNYYHVRASTTTYHFPVRQSLTGYNHVYHTPCYSSGYTSGRPDYSSGRPGYTSAGLFYSFLRLLAVDSDHQTGKKAGRSKVSVNRLLKLWVLFFAICAR